MGEPTTDVMMIDVHAHAVLPSTMGAAGANGPEMGHQPDGTPTFRVGDYVLCGVRYEGSPFMDVDRRLEAMDEAGIDLQVLSPNPLTYFHHVSSDDAVQFCRRHNDDLAELVDRHPGRLRGLAALPMQDVDAAIVELERATGELGLLGAYVGTDFGVDLDDPSLDELYQALVALDVPLFLHPAPSGLDGPARDRRLRRFDLDLLLEFAYEEMLAVATLVFGGVVHRHPDLDVCISHGGGATPMMAQKMGVAASKRPWAPEWLRQPGAFEDQLRRLWFDCHVHGQAALSMLTETVGEERLVFGTNFAGWDQGAKVDLGGLPPVLERNARRLLRL